MPWGSTLTPQRPALVSAHIPRGAFSPCSFTAPLLGSLGQPGLCGHLQRTPYLPQELQDRESGRRWGLTMFVSLTQ